MVQAENVHFAFVKATEGNDMSDSLFCYNWASISETNIYKGAYHFLRFNSSGAEQAHNFLSHLDDHPGHLPPVLDIEVTDGVDKKHMINTAYDWIETVHSALGVQPIIYTNLRFYNEYLSDAFSNHTLWIARYNTTPPVLKGGAQWSFWQYGDKGQLKGIDGYVDFNVFNGNLNDLREIILSDGITYH